MGREIKIIGGGLAGLLAAYHLSKKYSVTLLEKKEKLDNNHSALLRFKEDTFDFIPIELEKAEIHKAIYYKGDLYTESNIKFNNLYSQKVTGTLGIRSINNLEVGTRFIPPRDFFERVLEKCQSREVKILTNQNIDANYMKDRDSIYISTIPLPFMLELCGICYDKDNFFRSSPINTLNMDVPSEYKSTVHQTIYFPESTETAYRISIIGDRITAEYNPSLVASYSSMEIEESIKAQVLRAFGLNLSYRKVNETFSSQKFGKIVAVDNEIRKNMIYNLTKQTGIFSLGRFATWRQIMINDVIKDIIKIEKWIDMTSHSSYDGFKGILH